MPGVAELPEPAELAPDEARLRVYEALWEVFRRLAGTSPTLLVLDDIQWADELTMGWLSLGGRAGSTREVALMILALYRTEERNSPITALLEHERVRALTLGRLGAASIADMVRSMLAMPGSPPIFVDFLHGESQGNPFFVAEYLRTAVSEGLLERDRTGRWRLIEDEDADEARFAELGLPSELKALVERRLGLLGPDARRLADLAAVLGRELERHVLAEVSGDETLRGLDELIAGWALFFQSELEAALERCLDVARRASRLGQPRSAVVALVGCVSQILIEMGDLERAERDLRARATTTS